jgi:hypothetical protein
VVGKGVDVERDEGLWPYINALDVRKPNDVNSWLQVSGDQIWIKVWFGAVSAIDHRNIFAQVLPFSSDGFEINNWDYSLSKEWVKVSEAADDLGVSASTIRRKVKELEGEYGSSLVRRTEGNQRLIRLRLLQNLWDDNRHR